MCVGLKTGTGTTVGGVVETTSDIVTAYIVQRERLSRDGKS